MTEPHVIADVEDAEAEADVVEEVEILDAEPVLGGAPVPAVAEPAVQRTVALRPAVQVAVKAATVAATGVVAGVVGAAVVRHVRASSASARPIRRPGGQATGPLEVVATHTYLVRVHELGPRGE